MVDMPEPESGESHVNLIDIVAQLSSTFNLEGLRALSFHLGIDYEELKHDRKSDLATELANYAQRQGRLTELEAAITQTTAGRRDKLAEYRQRILHETQFLELKGIPLPLGRDGSSLDPQIPLDKVYIQLQAVAREEKRAQESEEEGHIQESAEERISDRSGGFRIYIRQLGEYFYRRGKVYESEKRPEPINLKKALAKYDRFVVLGAPGSGKSTLLRYLARRATENDAGPLPILVSLRDYAAAHGQDSQLTLRQLAIQEAASGDKLLQEALEHKIEEGQVLWLLDALDEARDWANHAAKQASRLPGRLVLTSRPVGYVGSGLQSLPHFEVLPIAPDDVDTFVKDWLKFIMDGSESSEVVTERANHLQAQLAERPQLQPLTRNPLLLTFLVSLVGRGKKPKLPHQRAQLYQRYVVELRDWEVARRKASSEEGKFTLCSLDGKEAEEAALNGFHYLGWALHLNFYGGQGESAPDQALLKDALTTYFEQDKLPNPTNLARDVFEFWQEAGMLDIWNIDEYTYLAFRHLTFQEYAAAWGLNCAWQKDTRKTWRFLLPRLHHYAWREPILLLAELMPEEEKNNLVRRLLRGRSPSERYLHRDLRLASAIFLGDAKGTIDEKLQEKIFNRLARLATDRSILARAILVFEFVVGLTIPFWLKGVWPTIILILAWIAIWFIAVLSPQIQSFLAFPTRAINSSYDRHSFLRLLAEPNPVSFPYLISALKDGGKPVRRMAAEALKQNRDPAAILHLISALRDRDSGVRARAAEALGQIGDPIAVTHLISDLRDRDSRVRARAAEALGQIGDPIAVNHLISALRDRGSRIVVVKALGQIGDPTAVTSLISALRDEDLAFSFHAAEALGRIGDSAAVPDLISVLNNGDVNVSMSLNPFDISSIEILSLYGAAKALGQIGDPAATPSLISALDYHESSVRYGVIEALGQIGDPAAIPFLISSLNDNSGECRRIAARALGQIGGPAIPQLIMTILNDNYTRASAVAKVLRQIGDKTAVPYLITALNSNDDDVRFNAALALGEIGNSAAVPHLITALNNDNVDIRLKTIEALQQIGSIATAPHLMISLSDSNKKIRTRVAVALGMMGNHLAAPQLLSAIDDDYIPDQAFSALISILSSTEDLAFAKKSKRMFWWRLTGLSSTLAYEALSQVEDRITFLEVAGLPISDPLQSQ